jgi:hypothetical protein
MNVNLTGLSGWPTHEGQETYRRMTDSCCKIFPWTRKRHMKRLMKHIIDIILWHKRNQKLSMCLEE